MFSLDFFKTKKTKCMLITPPLLEPNSIYPAMPILAGQLIHNGYNTKNLDLNIKFFKRILSIEYIEKTKQLLKKRHIEYDNEKTNFLIQNIENALNNYKKGSYDNSSFKESEEIIFATLKFISMPYKDFTLCDFSGLENCFSNLEYNYKNIKEITFDEERNIFISFFKEIVKEIKKQKVNFIGITIPFSGNLIPALTLARLLKEKTKIHIALGGNFLDKDDILNNSEILDIYCDSVLIGDGEESIVELVKFLEKKQKRENISGLIYKNIKNEIIYNKAVPITKINQLANISHEGIDFKEYMSDNPNIHIAISKGCYWGKCSFCRLSAKDFKYCIQSPQKVIENIKEIINHYGTRPTIFFQDDALHPTFLNEFADLVLKEHIDIGYFIFARFEDGFTKELFKKLIKSGLGSIYWGLESGSKTNLEHMNKGINLESVPRILKDSCELGIHNMAGVIINFPTETQQEFDETIEFLNGIKKYVTISPGQFAVMKHSDVAINSDKYGIKILESKEFCYCPFWEDTNKTDDVKQKRWDDFCNWVKSSGYQLDSNKNL